MGAAFASGKYALGTCDRCGQTYKLKQLKVETVRGRPTGIKACPVCWDLDHPQNRLGETPVSDPQALRDPRPDTGRDASRELTGMAELEQFLQG